MAAQHHFHLLESDTGTPTVEQYEKWWYCAGWQGVPGSTPLPAQYPWVLQSFHMDGGFGSLWDVTCGICGETVIPSSGPHPDVYRFHRAHKDCALEGTAFRDATKTYDVSRPDGHYTVKCRDCGGAFTTEDADDIQLPTHHERCGQLGRLTKRAAAAPATSSDGASTTDVSTG